MCESYMLKTHTTAAASFFLTDTLDVACGNTPKGTVNVDLFPIDSGHRGSNAEIKTRTTRNFIQAECHHLPFPDNTFNIVQCHQLIEHKGVKPMALIRELIRVARYKIIMSCPHRFASFFRKKGHPAHVRSFNVKSMMNHLNKAGISEHQVITTIYKYEYFPFSLMPIFRFPQEMKVEVYL